MATTAICGSTGSVSLGGEIVNWTLNLNRSIHDATSIASAGNKEFIGCLIDADGTFESYTSAGTIGAHASVDFINDSGTWSMDIIVTSLKVDLDVNSIVKFTYTFVSSGAITGNGIPTV